MHKVLYAALIAICAVLAGCSTSCRYGPPEPGDVLPQGIPVGTILRTKAPLLGLLDESVDDASIHYLNVEPYPGHAGRLVKLRVEIPKDTEFRVIGYRRPFSPLCDGYDWELVLSSTKQFTPNRDAITVDVSAARAYMTIGP
jgi:hypothetical protein